jgi:predicted Zn-dependent peptidase
VKWFSREKVLEFFRRWYAPNAVVITAAGNLEHRQLLDIVAASFGDLAAAPDGTSDTPPRPHARITTRTKRELEQVHICLGVPSYPITHQKRFAINMLNNILGGGMSSRLFQNIREKQGLAYAVFSELSPYRDAGMLSIYAGTALETAGRVVRSIIEEFRNLKEQPVTEEELRRAKNHLKGALLL